MTGKELGKQPANPTGEISLRGGLTKREVFAMAAMQGLLSSPHVDGRGSLQAVTFADKLLDELAKEQP